ncbi:MAG TPA: PQQ-dependent sugar dehydrogenase [Candidatus Limnocylindria bacterium]|jgi:glucose/arabinose dehydrogenase|nr:PQQ-dependent sugar dehydrogenase [Candidatus Limnocylindria bacterium]
MTHRAVRRPSRESLVLLAGGALLVVGCTSASASPSLQTSEAATPSIAPTAEPSVEVSPPGLTSGPDALAVEPIASGFVNATAVTNAGDGSGRLFVVQREGQIRIVNPGGTVETAPFLDITGLVLAGNERGLLGLTFHPDYEDNGRFFVSYTARPDGPEIIAEYRVSSDPSVADPASGRILISVPDPAANHNGGALAFGPDGYLYISMGDGGGQNDQYQNGQNLNSLLGKLLRIDVDGTPTTGRTYAIPSSNPFVDGGGAPEIWAYGLRNPWRISFDREWGDLFIGDVGGGRWEEINRQPADGPGGLNYGWPVMEGRHCLADTCTISGYVQPIAEYSHDTGGCSVIGGYVYRGSAQPDLAGVYIFGDWCTGTVFTLQVDEGTITPKPVLDSGLAMSAFGEDDSGEIYLVDFAGGGLYRVVLP